MESFLAGSPAKIAIPGTSYSGGIETLMVPEWTGMESGGMQLNRFIYLFILQLYFLSLFQ